MLCDYIALAASFTSLPVERTPRKRTSELRTVMSASGQQWTSSPIKIRPNPRNVSSDDLSQRCLEFRIRVPWGRTAQEGTVLPAMCRGAKLVGAWIGRSAGLAPFRRPHSNPVANLMETAPC